MMPSEAIERVAMIRSRLATVVAISPEYPRWVNAGFGASLRAAAATIPHDVYVWNESMARLLGDVARGFPMESHVAPEDLVTPSGCWIFAHPLRPDEPMVSYVSDAEGLRVTQWIVGNGGEVIPLAFTPTAWRWGDTFGRAVEAAVERDRDRTAEFGEGHVLWTSWLAAHPEYQTLGREERRTAFSASTRRLAVDRLSQFGAGIALLRQQLLVAEPPELDRGERRRLARLEAEPSQVHVVRLRRTVTPSRNEDPSDGLVEWSHRWLVRGHWTQQPYGPKQSLRRAQWIHPYVKGPEDKPLKAEAARVFAVNR
jgi:hypothetical protein